MTKTLNIEIEATNICNTVCMHCPHDAISRPSGKMSWENFQVIADKVMAYSDDFSMEFAGMGEPLLNNQVYNFIKYVSGRGKTSLTTNASALTPQNMQKLVDAGLQRLTISFNGEDKTVYELMMGGLNFERAISNISKALEISRGSGTLIGANVSVTRQTQSSLEKIRDYLEGVGIRYIFFSKCHHRGGFLKGDLICTTPLPPVDTARCDIFGNTLFVAWSGDILACCHDLAGEASIGSAVDENIDAILQRKAEISAGGVKWSICKHCNDLYRFWQDNTPDGRPIVDWVYGLYTQPQPLLAALPGGDPASSLSQWMYKVYESEGQAGKYFGMLEDAYRSKYSPLLAARVRELDQQITDLTNSLQERERQIIELQDQIAQMSSDMRQKSEEAEVFRNERNSYKGELDAIRASRSWGFVCSLQRLRQMVFPLNSRREKVFQVLSGQFTPKDK